jgi:cobalt-zinc-cadmium efflux system outer membrane protein
MSIRTRVVKRTLVALMLVAGAAAAGRPAAALTLDEALARAQRSHPSLPPATATIDAARVRLAQARRLPANPVVALEVVRHSGPDDVNIDRGVTVSQEVEIGGQRGLRILSAEHEVAHAEELLADRRRTIAAEARRAFAGVIAAERRGALAREAATLASRLLEIAERRVRAGDAGDIDVQLARIQAIQAAQAETLATVERARAAARLASAIGADAAEVLVVDPGAEHAAPPTLARDTLVAHALATRPDLAAAREERARLEAEAALARRHGRIPNPVFQGIYREELGPEHFAGGAIALPFPIWNRDEAAEATLLAAAASAAADERRLLQEVPRQVEVAALRRDAAASAWARYEREALPAGDAARAAVERAYTTGYFGLTDALAQQDRLLQVRTAAIATWLDLHEADADLIEALGGDLP